MNNPPNLVDPSGLSASIFMDWGKEVHDRISEHFTLACGESCSITNQQIGKFLKTGGSNLRPDLVDICDRYVYEIKTVLEFISGIAQVEGYVETMNELDPSAKINPWRVGGPYVPPSVVPLRDGSFAIVSPPDYGVVTYQVIDMRAIMLAAAGAIAVEQYSNLVAGMSGALSMASLGVVF